jgi:hypothetical protein
LYNFYCFPIKADNPSIYSRILAKHKNSGILPFHVQLCGSPCTCSGTTIYRVLRIGRHPPLAYKRKELLAVRNHGTEFTGGKMRFGPFLVIALLLLLLWAGGFLMFHVASGLIHLLLLFAVVSFVVHLVTGSRTA